MTSTQQKPFLNARGNEAFRFLGSPTMIRATAETTGGAYGLVEAWEMSPGFGTPYHTHHREDESFYVLEGEMAFVCGGNWVKGGPGTFVYGPREIAHGFKVIGNAPARMLLMCNPGGFEGFVTAQATPIAEPPSPPDMAKLMTLAVEYGIDIHGPLPEEPAGFSTGADTGSDLKSFNHRWIQAFNDRDWQTERAVRSDDFVAHMSGMEAPLNNEAWSGFMSYFTTSFPDARIAINSCVAEGDQVVARWTITGTHRGEFQGIPATGRAVEFGGIEFNLVKDGKLVEHRCMFDNVGLMRQLGGLPTA
jgi:steroid delta-isomerase-like uncharacterized protein